MTNNDWQNYFFHVDFSKYGQLLSEFPLGILPNNLADKLVMALRAIDTDEGSQLWNNSTDTDWSLQGVEVIYNDINRTKLPAKYGYRYALGLNFPQRESGITGRCYLVWNP